MARVQPDSQKSSYQQEMERRSNDLLRVYNPTDERFIVEWDRRSGTKLFPVEAKEEAVHPRYIAEKYLKEMFTKMLNDKAKKGIMDENKKRIERGMAEMDKTMKTNEQMAFEEKFYNPDNDEARRIMAVLYVGIESEYGVDRKSPEIDREVDDRPAFEKAMEDVQERKDRGEVINGEETPENGSGEANEPKYVCDYPDCGFEAKNSAGLMAHKRSHRDNLEEKKKQAVSKVSQ